MLITPEGWSGNFSNAWTRTSNQFELLPVYRLPLKGRWGRHELKLGADYTRRSYELSRSSHPTQLLREDGSVTERIDFTGAVPWPARAGEGGGYHTSDFEIAEFVQEHWVMNEHLAMDLGGRLITQSIGRSAAFAPRAGLVYSPDHKAVIRAGAGLFYDRVPLLLADFADDPTRVVTLYGPNGVPEALPIRYQNAFVQYVPGVGLVPTNPRLDTSPRNFTWKLEVDRELWRGLSVRTIYLYSQTQDLYVITPLAAASGRTSLMGLADRGGSHYHELETTLHYRAGDRSEVNASYIHSHARGDLNTLSDVYVPFEQPVIRPDVAGTFAPDVPNRVVGWGTFSLPWTLTASPVVDVHSGLPYSKLDELRTTWAHPTANAYRHPSRSI
jgi:hypothetical protein